MNCWYLERRSSWVMPRHGTLLFPRNCTPRNELPTGSLDPIISQKLYPSQVNYLLEVFELLVSGEALLLGHAAVDGDGGEVLLCQQLGQGDAPLHRLDEDDNLKEIR